jgi:hypothetical protein
MIEDVPRRSSDNCCGWRESCPPLISPCASSRVAKRPRLRCASDLQMHFVKGQTSSETVGPQNDSRDLDNSLRPISLASRPRCVSSSTKQVILAAPDEACSSTDSGRHYPLDIRPSAVGRCHRCRPLPSLCCIPSFSCEISPSIATSWAEGIKEQRFWNLAAIGVLIIHGY